MSSIPPQPGPDDFTRPTGNGDPSRENNPKAIFSLVLGVISIFCFGFVLGILAVVLGLLARREIAASGGLQGGRGLALAGIVTGVLGIASGIAVAVTGFQLDIGDLF